jgi:taurine transport system permease protein
MVSYRDTPFVRTLIRIGAVGGFLLAWHVAATLEIWPEVIVPRPAAVWERFVQSVTTTDGVRGLSGHYLWEHLWASLRRLLAGLLAALVVGVPLGFVMGSVRPVRVALDPFVGFVRSLPPLAYFSLLIIWFGIEDTSKIWLLFLAAVAPITLAVISGMENTRREWIESARSLGAGRLQVITHTVLPSVLPELITGVRLAIGFAFTTIVAAETVDGIPGIGGLAWSTKKFQQTDIAVLCVIVIGLTAVAIDLLVRRLERRLVPWKGRV